MEIATPKVAITEASRQAVAQATTQAAKPQAKQRTEKPASRRARNGAGSAPQSWATASGVGGRLGRVMIALMALVVVAALLSSAPTDKTVKAATLQAQQQATSPTRASSTRDAARDDESKPKRAATSATPIFVASQDDYYIGPTDMLDIRVEDAPELSQSYPVGASGYIEMQVIGKILAMGKTPDQLAVLIKDALIKEDYLKFPKVSVNVTEYNSRTFYIQGAVRAPGAYKVRGRVNILQLITLAGGLSEGHGPNAFIIRQRQTGAARLAGKPESEAAQTVAATTNGAPNGSPSTSGSGAEQATGDEPNLEMISTNINGFERGIFDGNIAVEPGDIVTIPLLDVFFIGGEVRAPGSYPLKEGTSLRQALALAQGTTFSAAKGKSVIFRGDVKDGKQLEIPVDLDAIMNGKKPDVLLQANDFIVVPNSRMKSVTGAMLQAFGMQTVQRGVIIR